MNHEKDNLNGEFVVDVSPNKDGALVPSTSQPLAAPLDERSHLAELAMNAYIPGFVGRWLHKKMVVNVRRNQAEVVWAQTQLILQMEQLVRARTNYERALAERGRIGLEDQEARQEHELRIQRLNLEIVRQRQEIQRLLAGPPAKVADEREEARRDAELKRDLARIEAEIAEQQRKAAEEKFRAEHVSDFVEPRPTEREKPQNLRSKTHYIELAAAFASGENSSLESSIRARLYDLHREERILVAKRRSAIKSGSVNEQLNIDSALVEIRNEFSILKGAIESRGGKVNFDETEKEESLADEVLKLFQEKNQVIAAIRAKGATEEEVQQMEARYAEKFAQLFGSAEPY